MKNEIDSLKDEISEKSANLEMEKENCTKLEQDLLRKTESFDQLIWSWAELEKFKEEKNQSKYDEQFEMGKRDKGLFVYILCET